MTERCDHREAIRRSGVMEALRDFDPQVVGTPPLGLDLPTSDIDILCHAPDPSAVAALLWDRLGDHEGFTLRQWISGGRPVIAGFHVHGWAFEIFAAAVPVREQAGWRHFDVERRLLALGGAALRDAVMAERRRGLKTEPAFAAALGLAGDPYAALLDLQRHSDGTVRRILLDAGFTPAPPTTPDPPLAPRHPHR